MCSAGFDHPGPTPQPLPNLYRTKNRFAPYTGRKTCVARGLNRLKRSARTGLVKVGVGLQQGYAQCSPARATPTQPRQNENPLCCPETTKAFSIRRLIGSVPPEAVRASVVLRVTQRSRTPTPSASPASI